MDESRRALSLRRMLADCWQTCSDAFGGYHPERHYMRGPGPKWRQKHGIAEPANPPWLLSPASPAELVHRPTRPRLH